MTDTELTGLDGSNPMGYFAALGCLAALSRVCPEKHPMLSWRDGMLPHPVLHSTGLESDEIVAALDQDRQAWAEAPALNFTNSAGAEPEADPESSDRQPKAEQPIPDVKLDKTQQRNYLLACRAANDGGRSAQLASALIAEGTFAKNRRGKPTDLHFTAGNQNFLDMARKLQASIIADHLREAVFGPWEYKYSSKDKFPTFGWDISDDRVYAYGFSDPSSTEKKLVPGADWLALIGLSAFPVRGQGEQSIPPGAAGSWKKGIFRWGLWSERLDWETACALVRTGMPTDQVAGFSAGVFRIISASIRRSDQGGYGSFSPPGAIWYADTVRNL